MKDTRIFKSLLIFALAGIFSISLYAQSDNRRAEAAFHDREHREADKQARDQNKSDNRRAEAAFHDREHREADKQARDQNKSDNRRAEAAFHERDHRETDQQARERSTGADSRRTQADFYYREHKEFDQWVRNGGYEARNVNIPPTGQILSLQNGDRIVIPYSPAWSKAKHISVTLKTVYGRPFYVARITNTSKSTLQVIREKGWGETVKLGITFVKEYGVMTLLAEERTGRVLGRLVRVGSGAFDVVFEALDSTTLGDPEVLHNTSERGIPVRYEISPDQ